MADKGIKDKLAAVRKRIEAAALSCGRDPESVKLVAVSKTKTAEDIREAAEAGAKVFGENYIKEALEKHSRLNNLDVAFHFIGHLQSNKAKAAVQMFDLIHSVDSLKLAMELDRQAKLMGKVQDILIQVNTGKEQSKSGIYDSDLENLVREISSLENLCIRGLMTIPPYYNEPEKVKPFFTALRHARQRIRDLGIPNVHMDELSMGMTGDFETAIHEGSTLVRIGTALFGERS